MVGHSYERDEDDETIASLVFIMGLDSNGNEIDKFYFTILAEWTVLSGRKVGGMMFFTGILTDSDGEYPSTFNEKPYISGINLTTKVASTG